MVNRSDLGEAQKTTLVTILDATRKNPKSFLIVLEQIRTALNVE